MNEELKKALASAEASLEEWKLYRSAENKMIAGAQLYDELKKLVRAVKKAHA